MRTEAPGCSSELGVSGRYVPLLSLLRSAKLRGASFESWLGARNPPTAWFWLCWAGAVTSTCCWALKDAGGGGGAAAGLARAPTVPAAGGVASAISSLGLVRGRAGCARIVLGAGRPLLSCAGAVDFNDSGLAWTDATAGGGAGADTGWRVTTATV